jgi:hypothetical protein
MRSRACRPSARTSWVTDAAPNTRRRTHCRPAREISIVGVAVIARAGFVDSSFRLRCSSPAYRTGKAADRARWPRAARTTAGRETAARSSRLSALAMVDGAGPPLEATTAADCVRFAGTMAIGATYRPLRPTVAQNFTSQRKSYDCPSKQSRRCSRSGSHRSWRESRGSTWMPPVLCLSLARRSQLGRHLVPMSSTRHF